MYSATSLQFSEVMQEMLVIANQNDFTDAIIL